MVARCEYTRSARHISLPVLQRYLSSTSTKGNDTCAKVILIDLRRRSEQRISHIPGAIQISYPEGGRLPEARAVMKQWEIPQAVRDADLIVAYCTAGWRGSVASTVLESRLGRPVYNLGGALLAWYNDGGRVVNDDNEEVEQMHPCADGWVQYFKRKNDFALT